MKVVRLILVCFIVSFFSFGINAQTVYVTENGKKYHKKNCDLVKTGKKGIELSEAKKQGFEACKHCKAEEATEPKKEKPKSQATK